MDEAERTRVYLTGRLDELGAARAAGDAAGVESVVDGIIRDDHPGARAVIADALRLLRAKQQAERGAGLER